MQVHGAGYADGQPSVEGQGQGLGAFLHGGVAEGSAGQIQVGEVASAW